MSSERNSAKPMLTPDALLRLVEGIEDVKQGRTVNLEEAKERLGIEE